MGYKKAIQILEKVKERNEIKDEELIAEIDKEITKFYGKGVL